MSLITQRLVSEIESAPEPVQSEVLDFVLFVKARNQGTEVAKRIRCTPGVSGGEACIGMTRIAVWMLEDARRSGVSDDELLQDYPSLRAEDLSAAWVYIAMYPEEIEKAIQENREA
jgi:uncharacterized protein (DUF433 family)